MKFQIFYGIASNRIDVTDVCIQMCMKNKVIRIPSGDNQRACLFTDPVFSVLKSIFVMENKELRGQYDNETVVYINTETSEIFTNHTELPSYIEPLCVNPVHKLENIHAKLRLSYGSFRDEYPEQRLAAEYILGHEKVLEIGGNIGRNSIVIGSMLNDHNNTNLVTMECCESIATQLIENRNQNDLLFHVENSALSTTKMYQVDGDWNTVKSETPIEGHLELSTITFDQLEKKYSIQFDTLILDCEGSFYYILKEMPNILQNIDLIIIENDFTDITHKEYVDKCMKENGLVRIYWEHGGWGPCQEFFYEVWRRI
jgi:FkbM family methyltransferase